MQPHLHLLVPQGGWKGRAFIELPSPSQEEVEAVLARMLAQAQHAFETLEAPWPQDAFEALQRQAAQERLELVLTAAQLCRRLLALIPPARFHLTSFHGVLSSHAKARGDVLPKPPPPEPSKVVIAPAAAKPKRPRLDWATWHRRHRHRLDCGQNDRPGDVSDYSKVL